MSRSLAVFLALLAAGVIFAATAAIDLGVTELRLDLGGPRRDYAAEELPANARGWIAVFGCVRHDLAYAVAKGHGAYRLGAPIPGASDEDPVFTPLSARDDCDDARPPRKIYALIEDDAGLGTTIDRVFAHPVAPPPVPAFVDGVAGFGVLAKSGAAERAVAQLGHDGIDVAGSPLLVKGKRPGVTWVAALTVAAGVHGYLLLLVGLLWWRRRRRRATAEAQFTDQENAFLNEEL